MDEIGKEPENYKLIGGHVYCHDAVKKGWALVSALLLVIKFVIRVVVSPQLGNVNLLLIVVLQQPENTDSCAQFEAVGNISFAANDSSSNFNVAA